MSLIRKVLKMNKRKRRLRRRLTTKHVSFIESNESKSDKNPNCFYWLRSYIRENPNTVFIPYNRESYKTQNKKHELHIYKLKKVCKKRGLILDMSYYFETCSGKILINHNRPKLLKAIERAKELIREGKNAAILATSKDRYLRNISYHPSKKPDAEPKNNECEELKKITGDITLTTYLNPNMSWKKVRSNHTIWAHNFRMKKVGRPIMKKPGWTKKRFETEWPYVKQLFKEGKTPTEISRLRKIPRQTIVDWLNKYL